jgi:hypothetical protein
MKQSITDSKLYGSSQMMRSTLNSSYQSQVEGKPKGEILNKGKTTIRMKNV